MPPAVEVRQQPAAPADWSLEAVEARWPEVLAALKSQQRRMAARVEALLREGRPVRVEGLTVVVGFPADREFHRAAVEEPQARAVVEKVLMRLFGKPITLRTERLDGERVGPELPPEPPPQPLQPLQASQPPQPPQPWQSPQRPEAASPPQPGSGPAAAEAGLRPSGDFPDRLPASSGPQAGSGDGEFDAATLQAVLRVLGGRLLKELDPDSGGR